MFTKLVLGDTCRIWTSTLLDSVRTAEYVTFNIGEVIMGRGQSIDGVKLLGIVETHAKKGGEYNVDTIAADLGVSVAGVKNLLAKLVKAGLAAPNPAVVERAKRIDGYKAVGANGGSKRKSPNDVWAALLATGSEVLAGIGEVTGSDAAPLTDDASADLQAACVEANEAAQAVANDSRKGGKGKGK